MNDGKDPYCAMLQAMRRAAGDVAPPGVCEGIVLASGPGVLQVRTDAGLNLGRGDLRVNAALVYAGTQQAEISVTDSGSSSAGGMYPGPLTGKFTAQLTAPGLRSGDRVALLPSEDGQIYYVLCKVVSV